LRAIAKGPEPASLTAHRQTPHSSYDNYDDKDALRNALVTEQRGICCYCMCRIEVGNMKIEHWRSQAGHPDDQLRYYNNLLGACPGGHGLPRNLQCCDTRKGNLDLRWNPAEPAHHIETRIRYDAEGSISSDEAAFDSELNDVLNLNLPALKNNRKGILDAVVAWWKNEKARIQDAVPRARFEQELARRIAGPGQLQPFCQVSVWWLQQRLARMRA
jgi:uncharacterized protein (TIGR02646 family)